jgi:hypothetical protein
MLCIDGAVDVFHLEESANFVVPDPYESGEQTWKNSTVAL